MPKPETRPAPVSHPCVVCKRWGSCGMGTAWYCVEHAPADYWPKPSAPKIEDVGDVI